MKKVCSAVLALLCLLSPGGALAAETPPPDTAPAAETAWYGDSVDFCARRGVILSDEGAPFDPDALLSKIAFIAMVSRAYGLYDEGGEPFYLAENGHFAAAVERGLVSETEFPKESWAMPLSRFEAAAISYRALLAVEGYAGDGSEVYLDNTADKGAIPQSYRPAVNAVYGAGIMNGAGDALTFHGWDNMTNAQGCVILHRLLEEQARRVPPVPSAYGRLLGSYTTRFGAEAGAEVSEYRENSIFNMHKAGAAINGVVLAPGQTFSFNGTVGDPCRANGYRQGIVVSGGKKVPGYGGGVCQTSTTLFCAALNANMTIKERHNHGLKSDYVPAGADSSIAYPYSDLKFQNPYDCPIKIIFDSDPDSETMTVKLYGAADTAQPEVTWSVEERSGAYILTRYADGVANYSCTSRYRD